MATTKYYADKIQIIDENQPNSVGTADLYPDGSNARIFESSKSALLHFPFPAELQYRKITSIVLGLHLWSDKSGSTYYSFYTKARALSGAFNESTTYNTAPGAADAFKSIWSDRNAASGSSDVRSTLSKSDFPFQDVLTFGVKVTPDDGSASPAGVSTKANLFNYVEVTYAAADDFGKISGSPTSGYTPKTSAKTFRWDYSAPSDTVTPVTAVSYRFAYRKGTSGDYTFVDCGSNQSYEVPAGTFDTNTVQWYPEATLSTGQTLVPVNSSGNPVVYTLSTVEPTFTATAVSPSGSFEDGSEPITFTWTASNSAGTVPSGAELQISSDSGSSWTTLGTVTGSALTYTAPANTLPSGQLSWRVRAINGDSVAGAWSGSLDFINVSAPPAPSVSSDAVPFATISWDAVGQQAAEVTVDGVSYGVRFGAEKSFKLPQPLSDGSHTAAVRIQGAYGLWSQPGILTFTIENQPDGTIALQGVFGVDADLAWNTSSAETDFLIYRDGAQIGHTTGTTFADRRSIGPHEWFILLRLADGNYTKSNVVAGAISADSPVIAALTGGPWIRLRLSDDSMAQQNFSFSRVHTIRHFSGSAYPVLELSPYEDVSGAFQCAFADAADARAFEALLGTVVILKHKDTVLVGGLVTLSKSRNAFYSAYQFTIEQIEVEEIVDDPNS